MWLKSNRITKLDVSIGSDRIGVVDINKINFFSLLLCWPMTTRSNRFMDLSKLSQQRYDFHSEFHEFLCTIRGEKMEKFKIQLYYQFFVSMMKRMESFSSEANKEWKTCQNVWNKKFIESFLTFQRVCSLRYTISSSSVSQNLLEVIKIIFKWLDNKMNARWCLFQWNCNKQIATDQYRGTCFCSFECMNARNWMNYYYLLPIVWPFKWKWDERNTIQSI